LEINERINQILGENGKFAFLLKNNEARIVISQMRPEFWKESKKRILEILLVEIDSIRGEE
jgi:hypothetical protein